jgi:hypothetical protein
MIHIDEMVHCSQHVDLAAISDHPANAGLLKSELLLDIADGCLTLARIGAWAALFRSFNDPSPVSRMEHFLSIRRAM